jgi:hypothetical protein
MLIKSIKNLINVIKINRFMIKKHKEGKKICFIDIDDTIATYTNNKKINGLPDYTSSIPIKKNVEKINKLYDEGNVIIYYSARGSLTKYDFYKMTKKQLTLWEAKFHYLRIDKPYFDILIDDRTKRIEEI